MKIILKILIVLWGLYIVTIIIGFIMGPEWGIYAITLPLVPFMMLETYLNTKAKNNSRLEFILEHSILLTTKQGFKASKRICNLEHLTNRKANKLIESWAKPFCKLEEEDKVYFYKDCRGCNSSSLRDLSTGYVLVRDNNPIISVEFDAKETIRIIKDGNKSDYYDMRVPIIEQLH